MWETWGESDSARGQNKYSSLSWLFWKNPQCLEKCTSVGRFPTKYLSWPKFWFWQPKKLLNPMTVVVQYHSTHTNSSFLCVFLVSQKLTVFACFFTHNLIGLCIYPRRLCPFSVTGFLFLTKLIPIEQIEFYSVSFFELCALVFIHKNVCWLSQP